MQGAAPLIGIAIGMTLIIGPVASSICVEHQAHEQISRAESTYEPDQDPKLRDALKQAVLFNRVLAGKSVSQKVLPYDKQLEYRNNSSNAWIEIPAIALKLPIYKEANEQTLAAGVGHLKGTSLPVGGTSSHCVLTAHSGMQSARMFDDIRLLSKGDLVVVHTLGKPFAYMVDSAEVVLPNQTEHLTIYQKNADMLTLLTCTPYGVNDHRLLVHCKRAGYRRTNEGNNDKGFAHPSGQCLAIIAGCAAVALTYAVIRTRNKKEERRWYR